MSQSLLPLLLTAGSIALIHTLLGPDHYLPFALMGRAGGWSRRKTVLVTVVCGAGHVLGSVVLGGVGIALGLGLARLSAVESVRGSLAAWGLVAFGLAYAVWGLRRAWRARPHEHVHSHADGSVHSHPHGHDDIHVHVHVHDHAAAAGASGRSLTPWVLFVIFVLGPCEPLIPLLMVPAAARSLTGLALVSGVFGVVTIATMVGAVGACLAGARRLRLGALHLENMERYAHALAGAALLACGLAIELLGV